jgi:hypothetical protein
MVLFGCVTRNPNSVRHQYRDYFVPVAAVNSEIGIQREDFTGHVKFREPNHTGVR